MSGPVRNYCVARGKTLVDVLTEVYAVPAGHTFILKSILLHEYEGLAGDTTVYLMDRAATLFVILLSEPIPANHAIVWEGWTVLNELDQIAIGTGVSAVDYWIAGALLPLGAGQVPPVQQLNTDISSTSTTIGPVKYLPSNTQTPTTLSPLPRSKRK